VQHHKNQESGMSESTFSSDVNNENFQQLVIEQSHQRPVVADFWASWCQPCQMLMPLLGKLAEDYGGKFFLAKINSDEQQELSAQYGIRSLPTVKIFRHGQIVDEFMGVQSESTIRDIIDRYIEKPSDDLREQALQALQQGNAASAEQLMLQALAVDPGSDALKIDLAAIKLAAGDVEQSRKLIGELPASMMDDERVKILQAQLSFANAIKQAPSPAELLKRIQEDPADLEARHQISAFMVLAGDYDQALEQLLEIMKRNRKYEDDLGRRGILAVFDILGNEGELVNQYRRKMAALLY
jgi:putative thioredoxin